MVLEARRYDCDAITFENLKQIRERISNGKKFQQWAFKKLQEFVAYKAEERGIVVDDNRPQYTSRRL
ncbi:IS200/IS605 family accessory protein TnpB-related protein [Halobacterium sp. KA-6]|uniref:IS200/IS605 family accessory protein TnpB-related protein n=1 Tax=Halobacterium sp. KA-6 TaxID=2896368 RepID=UPI001E5D1519|nr:IS200/IS605 family accessory protein TnpB-related protein [Halobacterium sp. KA-6]MCD2205115.1 IS200/IS605 family accessory protein TnpB-related protein [Halobacterium sp. KA-6]